MLEGLGFSAYPMVSISSGWYRSVDAGKCDKLCPIWYGSLTAAGCCSGRLALSSLVIKDGQLLLFGVHMPAQHTASATNLGMSTAGRA